ncbi:hypothetical protein JCM21900_004234 [Sporobolomyces salmonicolor]
MSAPQITVHWLENSRAQRILWLLEELELEYELKVYKRDSKTLLAPPELKEVHPLGKSPVVTIVDPASPSSKPLVLAESGAICEFILERYGNGKLSVAPTDADLQARAEYLYWMHFAEGTAMTPLMFSIVFTKIPKQAPFFVRPVVNMIAAGVMSQYVRPRVKAHYAHMEKTLEGKEWFVGGRLTGADIMMSFIAESLEAAPVDADAYPNIQRWFKAIEARPAWQKAEEKGGKNDLSIFTK